MDVPDISYAKSGDVSIAYQVVGEGPQDLVVVRGSLAHLDSVWEQPLFVEHVERLASFARVLLFDKRGMGLSTGSAACRRSRLGWTTSGRSWTPPGWNARRSWVRTRGHS